METREITYPREWESEFLEKGVVDVWTRTYPALFRRALAVRGHSGRLAGSKRSLSLFAQYALQFMLRQSEDQGRVESLTWYKLAARQPGAQNRAWIDNCRLTMHSVMGGDYERLRDALVEAEFSDIKGEPDLFCWNHAGWFFAEAKGPRDGITASQKDWERVLKRAVKGRHVIVYDLVPGPDRRDPVLDSARIPVWQWVNELVPGHGVEIHHTHVPGRPVAFVPVQARCTGRMTDVQILEACPREVTPPAWQRVVNDVGEALASAQWDSGLPRVDWTGPGLVRGIING